MYFTVSSTYSKFHQLDLIDLCGSCDQVTATRCSSNGRAEQTVNRDSTQPTTNKTPNNCATSHLPGHRTAHSYYGMSEESKERLDGWLDPTNIICRIVYHRVGKINEREFLKRCLSGSNSTCVQEQTHRSVSLCRTLTLTFKRYCHNY